MPAVDWRDRFADFEGVAYLDAANQGPLPLAAVRAGKEALHQKEKPWKVPNHLYFTLTSEVRALWARLFNTREEAVALGTGAGQAVNVVARGLEWKEGDEVVLPRHEFPSNYYPWLWLARRGVRVVEVEPDSTSGAVSAPKLAAAITPRTKVVAFALVSYLHGGRIDPAPVVEAARNVGAVTVCDASQAAGAMAIDFGASGLDLLTASAYKFLLGPYGTAVALYSPGLLEKLPVEDLNWWSVKGSEDFNHLPGQGFELRPGAQRYDAHEPASFVNLFALAEALRLVLEATPQATQVHCRALCDRLLSRLPAGYGAASPLDLAQRSHVLCVTAASSAGTAAAFERLKSQKVQVSLRGDRLRVSPHLYSTEADVDRLLAALA